MRILLVEDDQTLGDGLREGLRLAGHTVDWLARGDEASGALLADRFDAVVLDLALPGRSGLDVLSRWRTEGQTEPVLVLTAYDGTDDCIAGLDRGADDYVVKPVDLGELEARLRALVRRAAGVADNRVSCGPIELDRAGRSAWRSGERLELSGYEFALLEGLMERAGQPVGKDQLEARLYGWGDGPSSNSVQVLIHNLRRKLGARRIETVRGLGYRLVP